MTTSPLYSVLILAVAFTAQAQTGAVSAQRFEPTSDPLGFLDLESSELLPPGSFSASVWLHYANRPLAPRLTGVEVDAVTHRFDVDLAGAWAPLDWAQVAVAARVTALQSRSTGSGPLLGLDAPARAGLGALRVVPRFQLLDDVFSIALIPELHLPVSTGNYLGDSGIAFAPTVTAGGRWGRLGVLLNVGYAVRPGERVGDLELDDRFVYGVGCSVRVGVSAARPVWLDAAVSGSAAVATPDGAVSDLPLELLAGLRLPVRPNLTVALGGGAGLNGRLGAPAVRVFLGIAAATGAQVDTPAPPLLPPPSEEPEDTGDADSDGVPDEADGAPLEPEDLDGVEDHDGIPDPERAVPAPARPMSESLPSAGAGAEVVEPEDPQDAADATEGEIDTDTDGDGRPDEEDDCPAVAEDDDDFEDEDGCPDPDNDRDQRPDETDACPNVWSSAPDGCPADAVRVTGGEIRIPESVQFELGKAIVRPESRDLLARVAELLAEHDELRKVQIEGHTDARGRAAKNLALSQRRADAVRTALIELGVSGDRLIARGFGETRPVADNRTRSGRMKNRRVVFVITDPPPPAEEKP